MFIDQVNIHVKSGKGGDGMVHFRREKYEPRGGPDGGDGGKGGDVIFEVKSTLNTLSSFRPNQRFAAEEGKGGGGSQMTGHGGDDLIIHVPPGTVIYDAETGDLLGDLTSPANNSLSAKAVAAVAAINILPRPGIKLLELQNAVNLMRKSCCASNSS